MKRAAVAVIQPCIPHYREAFFAGLREHWDCDVYCLNDTEESRSSGFCIARETPPRTIGYRCLWRFAFFNPFPLMRRKYRLLILMASPWQMSNWLLMFLAPLLGKKVILWGQGVEVARYGRFERRPPRLWRWMYHCAGGAWFYTANEQELWRRTLPKLRSAALGNTLSGPKIPDCSGDMDRRQLRERYGIATPINLIFCARMDKRRRLDLLIAVIEALDPKRFGFLIVGDGPGKPDFSRYRNVRDFGAVYDPTVKQELFALADIYFQPAWLGLSVVEAMLQALPILTFSRAADRLQGVEYGYIAQAGCGIIVSGQEDLLEAVRRMSPDDWRTLGLRGQQYALDHLRMEQMVRRATELGEPLRKGNAQG